MLSDEAPEMGYRSPQSLEQKRVTLGERFQYNRSRSKEINMGALSSKP
jgi:hypothetical protein